MPIDIPALLLPISGDSPGGTDIRYHPACEKIKEARRQEENISQGVWKHEVKTANFPLALKLCTDVLTKQSKDLQIAAWITEALANLEGLSGLRQGLELVRGLLDTFWDSVYPQIEDGDLDLRAMPLSWIGSQLGLTLRSTPILNGGCNWYNHRSSRAIPTEEEAQADPAKQTARTEALEEGEVSPEDFERAFTATPFAALKASYEELTALNQYVDSLGEFCNEKFGDQSPDFGPLRGTIEEVGAVVRVLFKKKEELEGPPEAIEQSPPTGEQIDSGSGGQTFAAAATAPRRQSSSSTTDPGSIDDAIERVLSAARYLRREQPQNPVPYLLTRAFRWGEIRATQASPEMLAAPPTRLRMELKRLAAEGQWEALRDAVEDAASDPCSRVWLDLQRYAVQACRFSGCYEAAHAIVSELRALIADFPHLPKVTLADDTPAANPETVQWLTDENITPLPMPDTAGSPQFEPWNITPQSAPKDDASAPVTPDPYDLAMEAARSGRVDEAVEMLSLEIAQEQSGRARFLRRAQLAQICIAAGHNAIGRPVLRDLSDEISSRSLEDWETSDMISQPLALLYRSLAGDAQEEKEQLYARICKIDPLRALRLER
jgi:type VI secretion system protein ImpA